MLFRKKPSLRHELLKIDGQLLEVKVRLNPRARRMIVKVNPATGEICVTVPLAARSSRGAGFRARRKGLDRAPACQGARAGVA